MDKKMPIKHRIREWVKSKQGQSFTIGQVADGVGAIVNSVYVPLRELEDEDLLIVNRGMCSITVLPLSSHADEGKGEDEKMFKEEAKDESKYRKICNWLTDQSKHMKVGERYTYPDVCDLIFNYISQYQRQQGSDAIGEDEWISVERGLPPNLAFCWIYPTVRAKVFMSIFSKADNWFQSLDGNYIGVVGEDVKFFQPLIFPKPPKF